jgi:hypothetical protein
MDEDVVYGNSIIDAYEAESQLACNPRVVFAKSAVEPILSHLLFYANVDISPQNRHVMVDSDSQLFVNYLATPTDDVEYLPAEFLASITQHRDLIAERLVEFSGIPAIWSKYVWSALYHNTIMREYYRLSDEYYIREELFAPKKAHRLDEVYRQEGRELYEGAKKVAEFKSMYKYPRQIRPK